MKQTLSAVMAYEEASTPERATEARDHFLCSLKARYSSRLRLWQFEVLKSRELREAAAGDAAAAQMILIATRGAGELPFEVKEWIEVWLAEKCKKRNEQSALTVLFDAPPHDVGASALAQFAYLQRVARRGNMDFFVSTFDQPEETTSFSRLQFTQPHRSVTTRDDSNGHARRKPVSFCPTKGH